MTEAKAATQPPVVPDDAFLCPASSNQQALWFIDRLLPGQATYNIATAFELHGDVRWNLIQQTIDHLVDRHESLRTWFASVDETPMQVIAPHVAVPLRHVDLTSSADGAAQARALIDQEARQPFDMTSGPLIRARGVSIEPSKHVLVIVVHHSISDGWSQAVFFHEFGHVYRALAAGREAELPPVAIQYADYCIWQEQRLTDKLVEQQLGYWRQALAGTQEGLELPADRPRAAEPSRRGGCIWFEIDGPTTARLTQFCRAEGVTTFAVLVAVLDLLLQRYTGRDDITIGTPVAGRSRAELEATVGFITNTVAVRADLSGDPTFRELVGRVRHQSMGALQHQDVPFPRVVDALRPDRSGQQNPLFSVMCAVQRVPEVLLDLGDVTARVIPVHSGTSKFDWLWEFQERGGSCEASLEYSTDLFSDAFAARATAHFLVLLDAALAKPDGRLSTISLLSPAEVEQLRSWNDTSVAVPEGLTVLRMFEAQVAATPDRQAFRDGDRAATYRELSDRAWQLARVLRDRGVTPGSRVGLLMRRSGDLLIALLAVLRTGSAYVPMDPAYPRDRLRLMADDAELACVVTDGNEAAEAWHNQRDLLRLDAYRELMRAAPPEPFDAEVTPTSPCYVMYTSGSTGRPKGVVMPHGPLANLVAWQVQRSAPGVTTLQFGSPSFDVSFQEVFATWSSGGCLVVLPEALKRDPKAVLDLMEQEQVGRVFLPFVALETMAEAAVTARRFPPKLREVVTAGEQLRVTTSIREFFRALPACRLDNQYGPTETHVVTAFALDGRVESWPELPPIGRAITNVGIHVLDRAFMPVPVGVPGDIWITGACLADGYWRQPERTAERFRMLTIDGRDQRAYQSGDRGRYTAEGVVEFLGRGDDQVKIRGFRVEPGEVESAIERLPDVRQVAVVARPHAGAMRLLAFYVPATTPPPDNADLRQALQRVLPDYLVPAAFVAIDVLPTTPSGKIDRRRLPADIPTGPAGATRAGVPPVTDTERTIAALWKTVLGLADVSVTDNFFDVGGHSLAALRVFAGIETSCGVALPLSTLFRAPTIRAIARIVDEHAPPASPPSQAGIAEHEGAGVASPAGTQESRLVARPLSRTTRVIGLQSRPGTDADLDVVYGSLEADAHGDVVVETTETQQGLLFLEKLQSSLPTYNIPTALWLRGPFDRAALQRAVTSVEARHEALRTSFALAGHDGRPVARIHPSPLVVVSHDDVSLTADPIGRAERIASDAARTPFDLTQRPLWRVHVVTAAADRHLLVVVVHHLVFDGWSQAVFFRELGSAYEAFASGATPAFDPVPLQHADYAVWQRAHLTKASLERELSYWRDALAGAAEIELPTDRPRRAMLSGRGDTVVWSLGPEVTASIRRLARSENATTFMVVAAAVNVFLARVTGQPDVVVGAPFAGRVREELENVVGFLTNTVALRTRLDGRPGFREVVHRVRHTTLGALDHQAVSFQHIVETVRADRQGTQHPLFHVMCSFLHAPDALLTLSGVDVAPMPVTTGTAKFDVTFEFIERADHVDCAVEFSTDLLDAPTVRRWSAQLTTLLTAALTSPDTPFTSLPLLSAEDETIIRGINATAVPYERTATIAEVFEARVKGTPDRLAAVCGDEQRTYAELNRHANRLAGLLRTRGVGPGVRVGIGLDRSIDLLVSLLAVLKAGAVYVPLDLSYPPERIRFMLADSGAALVITLARHAATFDGTVPVIAQDDPTLDLASQSDDDLPGTATAESLAYVMYTSGSTGVPKGVGVTHRGVLRLVRGTAFVPWTDITAVLHLASVSFDASTFEIWGPLLNGARSVIVPERLVEFEAIERAIRRGDVDCVWLTAALFNTVIDTRPGLLAGVKWVLAGGEALSVPHVRRALGLLPATQLINGYGPTETTTFACCYPIPRVVEEAATSIPIGRPIANTTVHVLDAEGEHVPVGVTGELFIGGDGVAAGYLNRLELTEQRFLPDRFSNVPGARLYRTGDLVRLRSDGNLVFLGRADRQVKIRGFRIEPGEIEAVLGRHPAVKQCVVVVREDVPGERRLVAYAEADAGALSDSSYRTHMEAALPAYMIPASLVVMPALPLTASGKIDQGRLPADAPPHGADRGARRPPVTTTEQTIAAIWTSVLGVTDLSVTDNFFDVGGHSLAALRVFSAIESACGVSLPLSVLLRAQTIERLARLVEEQGLPDAPPQWAPVVVINDAAGPPLVGVHSLSGDVLEYRLIARYLSPDQRVIGLQAPLGPDEDIDALFGSIEATAERYVRELRRVQPEGPYYLCGWSSGGSIALEMAQRLTRTGSTVALLAVIDSAPHVHGLPRRPALSRLGRQLANLPRWIRDDLLATAPDMLFRRIAYGLRTGLRRVIGTAETDPNVRDLVDFPARHSRWERFAERHFQALRRYVPAPYQGRVSLFSAQTQPLAWLNDADVTWRHLATGVDVYPVPGTHFSMVQEPNVKALAEAMSRALANAARTDGASGRGRL